MCMKSRPTTSAAQVNVFFSRRLKLKLRRKVRDVEDKQDREIDIKIPVYENPVFLGCVYSVDQIIKPTRLLKGGPSVEFLMKT